MAYTALAELTASMGNYYELVIKPSYEQDRQYNQVRVKISYGVRKIAANSATYNIDAAHMWAAYNGVQVLGADGKHIDWDQRQDPVGTYREYASGSVIVQCNNDGTSSINLYAKFNVGNVSAAKSAEINRTITLPRVPRASVISATPTFVGQSTIITIQRASSTFTHTVKYSFSVFQGTIGAEKRSDTSFSWVVPTDFYRQLVSSSASVTLTCDTYDGAALIGQSSCQFTVTVPEAPNRPSLTGCMVVDVNPTCTNLEGETNIIRYRSVLRCTCSASAKNFARIQSVTVNGQEMGLIASDESMSASLLISNVDTGTFVFTATDTRGFKTSVTQRLDLVPYEVISFSYTWARTGSTSNTVNININGRFFNGSFGYASNTLTVELKVRRSGTETWGSNNTVSITKSGNTWKGTASLSGITYDNSYDVWILAYDVFGTEATSKAEVIFTIPPGTPVFDWGKNDLTVNKRLYAKGGIRVPPGDQYTTNGIFGAESANNVNSFRLIGTGKNTSGADVVYVGWPQNQTSIYGNPLYAYFRNNAGGICFENTQGTYYNCCWSYSNRIYVGNTNLGLTLQGNSVTLGSTNAPTYIYGSYIYLYVPNNAGGVLVTQKNGSHQNIMWINSSDEVYLGSTLLVTRLSGTKIYSSTTITSSSDRKNKKAIEPVSDAYEKLLDKIEPQRFRYKDEPDDAPFHVGYVAQDVLAALEDVGLDRTDLAAVAGEDGDLGIAYAELVPLLHKKVKTLEARVEQLESLVEKLLKAHGISEDDSPAS